MGNGYWLDMRKAAGVLTLRNLRETTTVRERRRKDNTGAQSSSERDKSSLVKQQHTYTR